MERYERDDGRYYYMSVERCLYGPALVVWRGGLGASRVVVYPMPSTVAAEKEMERLAALRRRHDYERVTTG